LRFLYSPPWISNGHLYNLRKSNRYRERLRSYTKTRPTMVTIGERRKPNPQGQPGFLRVDTVHQGDRPEAKSVYHINAVDEVTHWQVVDEVTQWQVVVATPRISEAYLGPVLEAMLRQFPFVSRAFTPTTAVNSSTKQWRSCSTATD
jgi:hypothetical protein